MIERERGSKWIILQLWHWRRSDPHLGQDPEPQHPSNKLWLILLLAFLALKLRLHFIRYVISLKHFHPNPNKASYKWDCNRNMHMTYSVIGVFWCVGLCLVYRESTRVFTFSIFRGIWYLICVIFHGIFLFMLQLDSAYCFHSPKPSPPKVFVFHWTYLHVKRFQTI